MSITNHYTQIPDIRTRTPTRAKYNLWCAVVVGLNRINLRFGMFEQLRMTKICNDGYDRAKSELHWTKVTL